MWRSASTIGVKEFTFNIRIILGVTALIAVHFAARAWVTGFHDQRWDIVKPISVACACAYWLAVVRAPYHRIYAVSFVASLFSTAAAAAEIYLSHGMAGFYSAIANSGSHALKFLACLAIAALLAGTLGAAIRAFINYVYPPWVPQVRPCRNASRCKSRY